MSWRLHNPWSTISKLIARDGITCCWCGKECDRQADHNHPDYPTIEHMVPRSKGGYSKMNNLRVACRKCNNSRGSGWSGEIIDDLLAAKTTRPLKDQIVCEPRKRLKDYRAEGFTVEDAMEKPREEYVPQKVKIPPLAKRKAKRPKPAKNRKYKIPRAWAIQRVTPPQTEGRDSNV